MRTFTKHSRIEGLLVSQADGMRWLGEGPLRVPAVVSVTEEELVMERVEPGSRARDFDEQLGRGLAQLHQLGADRFGATRTFIGDVEVPEPACDDWPTYYARARLEPLLARASVPDAGAIERVIERLPDLCGPPEPPARLHGDLWSGNVMVGPDGAPWLIDPSAYGGHREVDLAMLQLFGAPGRDFFAAYEEVSPLADGWRKRVALYQLLPLLVHAILFGGSYGAASVRAAQQYA